MIFDFGRDFQEAATWDSTDELTGTDDVATKSADPWRCVCSLLVLGLFAVC